MVAAAAAATVPFQNMRFLLSIASQSEKNANLKQLKLISQYVINFLGNNRRESMRKHLMNMNGLGSGSASLCSQWEKAMHKFYDLKVMNLGSGLHLSASAVGNNFSFLS